eukprot:NODE_2148_length_504_cov_70.246154_g1755_i0.p1 GENE.NODE_2148_length_504_cov_70.246154_g1755_i0~~NODE_2148_length_504_cov_70.246154_g1755_i0.p1  ORF type:complete len:128 (+),score=30.82 NODE_2148_length_504_cov_70.246154_g1755_i0:27-386(+)
MGIGGGMLSAEFVARALAAGGFIQLDPSAPAEDYMNHTGRNLSSVAGLHSYLQTAGWSQTSSARESPPGSVIIYPGEGHAVLSIGGGNVDHHDPPRCNVNAKDANTPGQWDIPMTFVPP